MENLLRNTDSTSIAIMFPESGPTHKAHDAHWITGWDWLKFITLWKTAEFSGKRRADYSSFLLDTHQTKCQSC